MIKRLLRFIGPGFITGASDDDPSGIATYSQTGAQFGYGQLWTALFSFPLMVAVQEMSGRIGLITGKGLAGVIKEHYSKKILYPAVLLLFVANTINIGADLGAMAAVAQLVFGLPFIVWLIGMVITTLVLEIFVSYKLYAKYLKYLTFSLFSYVITAFIVKINWQEVLTASIIPSFSFHKEYLFNIVAIFGTTISPYLFFWQASEEVEEEVAHHRIRRMGAGQPKVTPKDISRLNIDTIVGMFFSNLVMWFIVVTTGATLFTHGIRDIKTAQDAALALRPLAGDFAFGLFALGIIGTGFLAVPVLAGSASYAISESFGWKAGLYQKLKSAHGFYGAITIATLIGILINFIGIDPMSALYYTAVINGFIAPPLLIIILLIANNKAILKDQVNGKLLNILGIATVVIMIIAAVLLAASLWKN
ncbi:MAG: Nramp family divalent metal transporter [Candidatus Levyibacteriota bacterium]|nr:MAG: Nramp family divalent metal transporter [Candidatus Levybacteria bacterium]